MEKKAESCVCGREDKFYYVISESCVRCGACEEVCPAGPFGRMRKNTRYFRKNA